MYDGLLRLEIPEEAKLVAFADDVAVVIVAILRRLYASLMKQ